MVSSYLKQYFISRNFFFLRPPYTVALQVESVVCVFTDEADTVSEELNQWRAALTEHERHFNNWKKLWVGTHTHLHLSIDWLTGLLKCFVRIECRLKIKSLQSIYPKHLHNVLPTLQATCVRHALMWVCVLYYA